MTRWPEKYCNFSDRQCSAHDFLEWIIQDDMPDQFSYKWEKYHNIRIKK